MLLDVVSAGLIVILYSLASICLGAFLLRFILPQFDISDDENFIVALGTTFLLGQGVFAVIWQLLALIGIFSLSVIVLVITLALIAGFRTAWPILLSMVHWIRRSVKWLGRESLFWKVVVMLTILLVALAGLATVFPPPSRGDATAFYLALPKVIAASHRLVPLPGYESFTQVGLQGEMHFAALMSLSGTSFVLTITWMTSLAAAAMLSAIGREVGLTRHGQWIAMVALFTSSAFTNTIWDGKVDIFAAAMGLAAFYWALEAVERRDNGYIRLVGLFTGLAIVAKISYAVALIPGVLFLVLWRSLVVQRKGNSLAEVLRIDLLPVVLLVGFWVLLAIVPNIVKNTVLFHAPLAPFFSTSGEPILRQAWFKSATALRINVTYPLALVYGHFWGQGGNLSPLLLAFTPLIILVPRSRPIMKSKLALVLMVGIIGLLSWVIYRPTVFAPRYILSSLLVLLLIGARGADYVFGSKNDLPNYLTISAGITLLIVLIFGINRQRFNIIESRGASFALSPECDFGAPNADEICHVSKIINEEAEIGMRVYHAAYYRYWFRPDIIQCLSSSQEQESLESIDPNHERWNYLVKRGFNYLVVDTSTHDNILDILDERQIPEWMEVTPIFEGENYLAYRLNSIEPRVHQSFACKQISPPAWQVVPIGDP